MTHEQENFRSIANFFIEIISAPPPQKNDEKKHGHASVLFVISKSAFDTLTFKNGKYFGNGGKYLIRHPFQLYKIGQFMMQIMR